LKIIEDVKAGRVKADREIDELTMVLKNPEHPRRCRGFGWYHENLPSGRQYHLSKLQKKKRARRGGTEARVREKTSRTQRKGDNIY
jgi:hypothetical protein